MSSVGSCGGGLPLLAKPLRTQKCCEGDSDSHCDQPPKYLLRLCCGLNFKTGKSDYEYYRQCLDCAVQFIALEAEMYQAEEIDFRKNYPESAGPPDPFIFMIIDAPELDAAVHEKLQNSDWIVGYE